jgi:hypothetical protein
MPLTFHTDAQAWLVACEWRQQMRQQLLAGELADNPGWRGLAPVVLLFAVAPCPAAFRSHMDHVVSVHVAIKARLSVMLAYFAMQTFFGSVKKPAFAKATARQAPSFAELFISLYKCSFPP